jgi:hypothetical protein
LTNFEERKCVLCPSSSTNYGSGAPTNVEGCRCPIYQEWDGYKCVNPYY